MGRPTSRTSCGSTDRCWPTRTSCRALGDVDEALGFPLPPALRSELETIDLSHLAAAPARRALLIDSHPATPQAPLAQRLGELGVQVAVERHSEPRLWQWTEDFATIHVPAVILDGIAHWIDREFA